jgi:hypothetical protein
VIMGEGVAAEHLAAIVSATGGSATNGVDVSAVALVRNKWLGFRLTRKLYEAVPPGPNLQKHSPTADIHVDQLILGGTE